MPKRKESSEKKTLTAADWEEAALTALEKKGATGVSVEGLARTLGATKGSFYWHFRDREALLTAALARWEAQYTDRVIKDLAPIADPRKRLELLIYSINKSNEAWRVHVALSASTAEPVIAKALARVSRRRIGYVEDCYRSMGWSKGRARSQAVLSYAAYVGFIHLRVEGPDELPDGKKRDAYFAAALESLIGRA
jgi:AcrR family transcriptional regulator